ncbi:MAG: zinc ribbon domain-containing protein [Gemmatimonadetes bacterium]|nr:zinc ribbon domain-containing protein [Gemmatimonadota bacterium]
MPIYEYRCSSCGTEFERRLRLSEMGEVQACPACGVGADRKLSLTAPLPVHAAAASCPSTGLPCACGRMAEA